MSVRGGIENALQRRSLTPLSVGCLRYSRREICEHSLRRDEIQTHSLKRTRRWEQEGECQACKDDERYLIGAIFAVANLVGQEKALQQNNRCVQGVEQVALKRGDERYGTNDSSNDDNTQPH